MEDGGWGEDFKVYMKTVYTVILFYIIYQEVQITVGSSFRTL